jgi:syntaxin 7
MDKLFTLSGNISRLSNEIALLGTKRDTERVRERVHNLLEESKDTFKEVGEGVKTIQAWEDVSVGADLSRKVRPSSNSCVSHLKNIHNRSSPRSSNPTFKVSKVYNDKRLRSKEHPHLRLELH